MRTVDLGEMRSPDLLRTLAPVRTIATYPHMRSRVRFQPVRTLGYSVVCESRLEATRVMELGRSGELQWLVAQPFWIEEWSGNRILARHSPDLLYKLRSGELVLENVRPPELRDEQFERNSNLGERLTRFMGWTYRVGGDYVGAEAEMLRYLDMYAQVKPRSEVVTALFGAFEGRMSWRLESLLQHCSITPALYPTLLALMWSGWLSVRLDQPLSAWSMITLGEGRN